MASTPIDELRRWLESRQPVDERERTSVAVVLAELGRLRQPYDEHAYPTHVTASAIVVGRGGVILHRHKRLGLWLQPGGHVDPGESLADAAVREAREETGLDARHPAGGPRYVHVDVHPGPRGHTHLDVRFLVEADGVPAPPPGESPDVRWFSWDEAIALADAGLRGALVSLRPSVESG